MERIHLRGIVREAESEIGIAGLCVKAHDKELIFRHLLGTTFTRADGSFEIVAEASDLALLLEKRLGLYLEVFAPDCKTLLYKTRKASRWTKSGYEFFDVRIPRKHLGGFTPPPNLQLSGDDDVPRTSFQPGESLTLRVKDLQPSTAHRLTLRDEQGELFTDTFMTDDGGGSTVVIWPLIGIEDPRSNKPVRVEEALERWGGRSISLTLSQGDRVIGETTVQLERELSRPLAIATDEEGFVRNGFEIGRGDARVSLYGLSDWESARVFMVPRQHDWRPGDLIRPIAATDVTLERQGRQDVTVARAAELRPGAYDFVVRRTRYGYEDDDDLRLRPGDVVGGRRITGLVVREEFMPSKVILGGCSNLQEIAGRFLGTWPYLSYTNVFQVGEDVWGALDPNALDPAHTGKMVAMYVVPHKPATGPGSWTSDPSLNHLAVLGGNANTQKFLTQSYCVNANLRLLWSNATQVGEYDVVADFGNDVAVASSFVPDDQFDMPADIIDGYIAAGFRIVADPATETSFANAGTYTYTETSEGSLAVTDDFGSTFSVPLRASVFFPADVPGATTPGQISTAAASYPLVVCVHGNSSVTTGWLGYDYLLEHLALNGFIAASIHGEPGMFATGRARVLRKHLEILFAQFGASAANNIGLMGHSRGGEAVMLAPELNQNEAWGYNMNAVVSLAPTDWILGGSLVAAGAPPVLVIYGSLDGDVAGIRDTGFELYDRASGMKKSMAFVYAACHDRFNTEWGDADFFFNQLGPTDIARVLSPAAHQAISKGYMTAFFRQYQKSETQFDGIFKGEWIPAAVQTVAPGIKIPIQYEDTTVRTVDDFEGAHSATSWQTSTIGAPVSQTGLPSTPQEDSLFPLDTLSPHDTAGLRLTWDHTTDALQWDIPGTAADVTGFQALSFRITQVPYSASNPSGQPQDLRVTLTGSNGKSRAIRVSKLAEIPHPDLREYASFTKSALCTIRIPLSAYTIKCLGVDEVDLTSIVSVRFELAEKPTGEIEIDSIQFTN
ncbi:MAG: hypothetical protein QOJ98_2609 [Acidobacteriota bacterium]|nr:hypothetical protein [Acidobacteriota bacterium]